MKCILLGILIFFSATVPVQSKMYEVVGTEISPLMYTEKGKPVGFYVDLLESMLDQLEGTEIKIRFYPAPRMFNILSSTPNVFSLGIARNDKREKLYKCVGPIYPRIFALFKLKKRSDIRVSKLEDIYPFKVGVGRGYAAKRDLQKAGIPERNIDEVINDTSNVRKLFAGRIYLVIMNDVMLAYQLKKQGHTWSDVEQVMILSDQYQFWYAFNTPTDDDTIRMFQRSLDVLRKNGEYQKIVEKYKIFVTIQRVVFETFLV